MWNIISLLATRQLYDYRALCWGAGHHDSIDTFSCNFLEISPLISMSTCQWPAQHGFSGQLRP